MASSSPTSDGRNNYEHHHSVRAKTSSPVLTPKKIDFGDDCTKVDGLIGNPYETRDYTFSRLRNAASRQRNRTPIKSGHPKNHRDLSASKLRELYAGYVATMTPGATSDPRVEELRRALIEIGHPDFIDHEPLNLFGDTTSDDLDQNDAMSVDDGDVFTDKKSNKAAGAAFAIKSEKNRDINIKKEEPLDNFSGCAKWEGRFWDPPYPPGYPAPIQAAPGVYQYPVNPDSQTRGAAYNSAGDGTFKPFSREAAVDEYFEKHPIQDTEATLQAFRDKYHKDLKPFDYGDDTDDKVLMCLCLKYDDGRKYIECDNTYDCMKRWFHPECLGMPDNLIPSAGEKWFCPDCLKEGRLGAAPYAKMAAFYAKSKNDDVKPKNNPKNKPTASDDYPQRSNDIKPWTADALKSTAINNPATFREFGISTLDEAKTTLLNRSTQAIGSPITSPVRPTVINGTVVKQPNKNSWTVAEDLVLVAAVRECHNDNLSGQPLWDAIEPKLKARGVMNRNMGAARNRWMRGLREEYQLDERRKKNANKLTTAIQVAKVDRDPDSNRKKQRYTVSRKAGDPAGHVQNALGGSPGAGPVFKQDEDDGEDVEMKGSPLRNQVPVVSSSSAPASASASDDEDFAGFVGVLPAAGGRVLRRRG